MDWCVDSQARLSLRRRLIVLVLRVGSDMEKTFGPTISGLIHRHIEPERLLLWDSKARGGRPDTMKILKEVYESWQAESTSTTYGAPYLIPARLLT